MGDSLHRIFIDDKFTKDGKKPGVVVTKHLAVCLSNVRLDTNSYKVYCIATNRPIVDCRIADFNSAVMLAQWIEQVYGVYLEIYEVYPDWDVLSIARLSVDNGEKTYEELNQFEGGIITMEQMQKAKERALA